MIGAIKSVKYEVIEGIAVGDLHRWLLLLYYDPVAPIVIWNEILDFEE